MSQLFLLCDSVLGHILHAVLPAGKQPEEVEVHVRELIESREGFTFLATRI